jgi:hypothetical protein
MPKPLTARKGRCEAQPHCCQAIISMDSFRLTLQLCCRWRTILFLLSQAPLVDQLAKWRKPAHAPSILRPHSRREARADSDARMARIGGTLTGRGSISGAIRGGGIPPIPTDTPDGQAFKEAIRSGASLAGWWHDLGKYRPEFGKAIARDAGPRKSKDASQTSWGGEGL